MTEKVKRKEYKLKPILLTLLTLMHLSASAASEQWKKSSCPKCQRSADGNFLFKLNGQIIKFGVKTYGAEENLRNDFLEIIWLGVMDQSRKRMRADMTFARAGLRESTHEDMKNVCRLFGYRYNSSSFQFTSGNYETSPDEMTAGRIKMDCVKELTATESFKRSLKRFVGLKSSSHIDDDQRSNQKDHTYRSQKAKSPSAAQK